MERKIQIPSKGTRFILEDFYQDDVDAFHDGEFKLLSVKPIAIRVNEKLFEDVEDVCELGWAIFTYSFTHKRFEKIILCKYKPKAWHNDYHIRSAIANLNNGDGFSFCYDLEEFIDWMKPLSIVAS